jgi:hypothetical protein
MRISSFFLASALIAVPSLAAPTLALADPTGSFKVIGHNTDGSTYEGTVQVSRAGSIYKIVWDIDGKKSIGTGLGSHAEGNTIMTGPATDNDIGLAVGYVNKDSFGICAYAQKPDGSWSGVWTYGGSQQITAETWTRQ